MNSLIIIKDIDFVIKNLPKKKPLGSDSFDGEFYQMLKTQTISVQFLAEKEEKITLSYPFNEASNKTEGDYKNWNRTKQKTPNYRPISFMNINEKIHIKILANWIQQFVERIIHHDQVGLIPDIQVWFNVWKSVIGN